MLFLFVFLYFPRGSFPYLFCMLLCFINFQRFMDCSRSGIFQRLEGIGGEGWDFGGNCFWLRGARMKNMKNKNYWVLPRNRNSKNSLLFQGTTFFLFQGSQHLRWRLSKTDKIDVNTKVFSIESPNTPKCSRPHKHQHLLKLFMFRTVSVFGTLRQNCFIFPAS